MKSTSTSQPKSIRHDARDERSSRLPFPQTDACFRATTEDRTAIARRPADRAELRAFRQISNDYLGEEKHLGYVVDYVVYALLTGLCLWSLATLGMLVLDAMVS
jgi:hypothetical protein